MGREGDQFFIDSRILDSPILAFYQPVSTLGKQWKISVIVQSQLDDNKQAEIKYGQDQCIVGQKIYWPCCEETKK